MLDAFIIDRIRREREHELKVDRLLVLTGLSGLSIAACLWLAFLVPAALRTFLLGGAPLTDDESAKRLREKTGVRILARADGRLVALFENKYALARIEQNEPELTLDHIIAG